MTQVTVWSDDAPYQLVWSVLYALALSLTASFLALRLPLGSRAWRQCTPIRALVCLVLLDSWIFILISDVLLLGAGSSSSAQACHAAVLTCICVYSTSKLIIYAFLMERIHLVHGLTHPTRTGRFASVWYRIAAVLMLAWIVVAVLMFVGRVAHLRTSDEACVIGLKPYASIPLLAVDATLNVFLTATFVVPIWRSNFPSARALAVNSSIAAVAALVTSLTNIAVLTASHGKQLSWVCLGSCGLDVFLNAAILFLLTSTDRLEQERKFSSVGAVASTSESTSRFASFSRTLSNAARASFSRAGSTSSASSPPMMTTTTRTTTRSPLHGPFSTPFPTIHSPTIHSPDLLERIEIPCSPSTIFSDKSADA